MVYAFESLLRQIREDGDNTRKWVNASRSHFAGFVHENEILRAVGSNITLVLHGSTARNIDDAYSDLDFWLVLDDEEDAIFRSVTDQSFIPVEINGKTGHVNPLPLRDVQACFSDRIDMVLANEISDAAVIVDGKQIFERFITLSKKPLSAAVRHAFFFNNYVEMRGYHRNCDNPMERGDRFAVLYNLMRALQYAFQAAYALDGRTYPYEKWLYVFAHRSVTAKALIEHVDKIINEVTTNPAALYGPEGDNKVSEHLRLIRRTLIDAAREQGIDGLWLEKWWRYIDAAKNAPKGVCWTAD